MDFCFPTANDLLTHLFSECEYNSHFIHGSLLKIIPSKDSDSDSDSDSDGSLSEEQMHAEAQKREIERKLVTSKLHSFGIKIRDVLGQDSYHAFIDRVDKIVALMVPPSIYCIRQGWIT